jgi:hypothetical protein
MLGAGSQLSAGVIESRDLTLVSLAELLPLTGGVLPDQLDLTFRGRTDPVKLTCRGLGCLAGAQRPPRSQ